MAFIGFDMDECLGCIWPIDEIIGFFCDGYTNDGSYTLTPEFSAFSDDFHLALISGYWEFIRRVASLEKTGELGILRPGILEIFRELKDLKEDRSVKGVMIYSNNGRHANLRAVNDILNIIIQDIRPFCDMIHYYHPYRKRIFYTEVKKFPIIKRVFEENNCGENVTPDNTLFIDDIIHPQIYGELKPFGGYFHCKPYIFPVSKDTLYNIFESALEAVDLDKYQEFSMYCQMLFKIRAKNIREFSILYKKKYGKSDFDTGQLPRSSFKKYNPGDGNELRDWLETNILRINLTENSNTGQSRRKNKSSTK